MAKDTYLKKILGKESYEAVRASKVLMVGAGGIGCELLKDLVLSGFGEIHIIDLDTITLSNLNRQFLFRKKDIDKLKSLTVTKAVQSFNYFQTRLVPHHGNVMNLSQFPIEWWNQFDYIFNALDNLEARRYVNKVALFLHKPLMESGTTGFHGQIQPIFPYSSECFECQVKETPKTFPVCTIRSTPSQPVHCIVWAKEFLFNQLFGETTESEVSQADLSKETDDQEEIKRIISEANELSALKSMMDAKDFPIKLMKKIYQDDVEKSLNLESLWKTREKPKPLVLQGELLSSLNALLAKQLNDYLLNSDTKQWSIAENLYVLYKSTESLQNRVKSGKEAVISFDKDDEDTLNFVAAAANLRSHVFNIPIKTKFDIKQIAGNIIPAIATTNAIISGFSNLGALAYMRDKSSAFTSKSIFISIKHNKRITSAQVEKPNPKCASCGIVSKGIFQIQSKDFDMTLLNFIDMIVSKYGFSGDISIILGASKLIYDYDFTSNANKKLRDIAGFSGNEVVLIQDEEDELENLELWIQETNSEQTSLPDLVLRPKQIFKEVEGAKQDEEAENQEDEYSSRTIVLDDTEPEDEGDEEKSQRKRRKIDDGHFEIID